MPEAQRDFDKSVVRTAINKINTNSSFDRIELQRDLNWSSASSIDDCYIPLVATHCAAKQPTKKHSQAEQNVLASSETSNFCCCSGETRRDLSSCWRSKRRQIIWESAHASAKNRTSAAATTTTRSRKNAAAVTTSTASKSLLPTLNLSTINAERRKTLNAAKNVDTAVNNSKGVSNISTSLPATPNLSHLQRRKYKKLSLQGEEFVQSGAQQQELLSQSQTTQQQTVALAKKLQMSATKVRNQLSSTNTAITPPTTTVATFKTTADSHPPSMLHADDVFAISAAATITPMKVPACNASRFLAKKANINYNNDNNHNNNNGALSDVPSSNKSTQSQKTCGSYSATVSTTTTTTNTATKSALIFCEHCCESVSMKSGSSLANSDNDRNTEAARLYCKDVDSVSGELSSFPLISEEGASNSSVSSATRSVETPNPCLTFAQATNNQTIAVSTRPSSAATTAAFCCYTIGHASVHYNATVVNCDAHPSVPVPISPPTNFCSAATSAVLLNSVPTNYAGGSGDNNNTVPATHADAAPTVRQYYCSIPQSSVNRKSSVSAPVPPPKPQRDVPIGWPSNKNRSFCHASYDPASFHRKLQKFEKQTALPPPTNTLTRPTEICDDEERAGECSSPEPCELLNCFGAVKGTYERGGVARNASSSANGSCAAPLASNLKCANNNSSNNNIDSDNHVVNTTLSNSVCAIAKLVEANNNYNCKINVANNQCDQHFSSTSVLNKRILRYDSCGRLKVDGSLFQQPSKSQKSLSESRLPQSVAGARNGKKLAPAPGSELNFHEVSKSASINNGYALSEHSHFQSPNSNSPTLPLRTAPTSPKSPTTPKSPRNQSDLDLSFVAQQQPEVQLFKSYSDTQKFVPNNIVSGAITSIETSAQTPKQHQQQQRSYSDYTLKSSNYPNTADFGCRCSSGTSNAGLEAEAERTTITKTNCSKLPALIHQQNSVSLPNVPHSNGSQSPLWLSSETVASSRCELKCSDDTQSVCSDQTTIFHLEQDYSSSSSPSSQSCGNVVVRGPLLLKRIPEIQSFGYLPAHSQSLENANAREQAELSMEKRRNTLDRFQRLGFGRKSSPSSSAAATATQTHSQESSNATRPRKSSEKSEKLKELTELLRGNRSSPTPPPVPPPRRPRHEFHSATNSFEQPDKQDTPTSLASAIDSTPLSFMSTQSDDILLMDHEESNADQATDGRPEQKVNSFSDLCSSKQLRDMLKPNRSLTDDEMLMSGREKSRSPPPIREVAVSTLPASSDIDTKLSRPESRTVIGSYAQKGIPFRSASFSQIDYSSGKYKKSALSVLRDRLRRDKAVDRAPSPTLPRNKDTGEAVLLESEKKEPDWVYIPLKKSDWNFSTEHKSLEDVAESPDAIIEEDVFAMEKETVSAKEFDSEPAHAAHAKMESLSDAILTEKDYTIEEEQLPITVKSNSLPSDSLATEMSVESSEEKHITSNLATLMEEEMPLESPPDNFLQKATTCLIPVPVYECAAQDWRLENPPSEWVEVASEEFGIVPETMQPVISMDQCSVAQPESTNEFEYRADPLPTISVKRSSEEEEAEDEDILRKKPDRDDVPKILDANMLERRQASLDYPEVKKRYSHDDMEIGTEKRSSLDSIATRYSADERKRLDKSRRRKGMYIESTDWSDGAAAATRALALDITIANFNAIKDDSPEECSSTMYLNSPITDENRTPGSLYSLDLNTPDSEPSKPPVWNKAQRLISFSCQSSEEKDESHSTGSGRSTAREVYAVGTPGVSLARNNTSYPFLRTDSISDNESDRTPPPSSDRSGVGSSESDFKRYWKRPVRGPYGQMLEAEMKKPNKMHFEEILEELRESEGLSSQPRRARAPVYGGRHEESDEAVGVGGGRNMPQYSNSMRARKTNTYLPVPSHARAASTPSQIENVNTNNNASAVSGLNKINPHEKRYQSTLDNAMTCEKREALASEAHQNHHQHHQAQTLLQQQQREMKRAASETPATKPHHSKRSQSMGGEKPAAHHQHHHQQKRSLDVSSSGAVAGGGGKQKNAANLMPTQELLAELLKGSSEKLLSEQRQQMFADTRTHVVQEIFKNEQSYVESLQTVVVKYLRVLKSPEHAGMIDSRTVDEIFFMVPDILEIHEKFLGEMRARLDNWDTQQKVGDAFMETFSKLEVLEVYTSFVNNCNRAKNAIRSTKHQRPSFAKFLETTAREHKGKLTLDNLLIKPVQKFPNYEMLFSRLIKHTDHDHPDQKHLQDVLKLVHDILVHINCKEREILENGQREAVLRELEGVIEGIADLSAPDRQFLMFDLVSMPSGQGARKERGFFLFNDLLVLTSIKKRSGTIRKPNPTTCPGTVASTLDTNKYKFLTKISLDCLEIVKTKDENLKRIMSEIENLAEDCNKLQQITDITASLKYPHQYLEDVIRELHRDVQRQLSERQTNDAQLNMLELAVNSPNGSQKLSIVFNKAEKRSQWEKTFNDAKQRLAATLERHPIPEFLTSIPIRKTRAGLQFTCAAATLSEKRNVWVCNSDGYVGQVCIMSLHPEPNVSSCNGVCNARILCVASVPAFSGSSTPDTRRKVPPAHQQQQHHHHHQHHQNDTQQHDYRKSNSPSCQTGSCAVGVQAERKKPNFTTASSNNNNNHNNSNNASSDSNTQLDLNFSSSDEEAEAGLAATGASSSISTERVPSPAPSILHPSVVSMHQHQDSNPDEAEGNQSTMWIGTEDGCIHVYNSTDNIRIKKNRIKIEHHSAVYSILYLDNRVFVSLANGDICVYWRDGVGWNTSSAHCVSIGTVSSPVSKLLSVHGKLWCSIQGIIKVLDIETLLVVHQIQISTDSKPITNMTVCNSYVWISIQNSAHIKCFHSNSHHLITEVNLAPAVNKMLSNCDEIIRQHKAACLRVTSLLSCKDLIWIGTSAGVLLTIPAQGYEKGAQNVVPTGIPHGHTGHVRFLTYVETSGTQVDCAVSSTSTAKDGGDSSTATPTTTDLKSASKHTKTKAETNNILVISGGDGYEDFRNSGANSLSEIAGREDSTNHLLIWQI